MESFKAIRKKKLFQFKLHKAVCEFLVLRKGYFAFFALGFPNNGNCESVEIKGASHAKRRNPQVSTRIP